MMSEEPRKSVWTREKMEQATWDDIGYLMVHNSHDPLVKIGINYLRKSEILHARLEDLACAARALVNRIRGLEGDAPDSAPSADAMRDAREEVERLRSVYTAARVLLRYEEDGATENWLYWDKRLDDLRAAVDAYEKESALAGHMP